MKSVGGKKRWIKKNGGFHELRKDCGMRIYETRELRDIARKQLQANGHNYFTYFKDVNGFGLSYGTVDWLKPGDICFQP